MRNWLRVIAALEMVGGVFGFGFLMWWLLVSPIDGPTSALLLLMLAINALSFVAGVALWSGSRVGRALSIIVQTIQLPKIISQQFVFMFSFGLDVWVFFAPAAISRLMLGFHFNFPASSQVFFNAPVGTYTLVGVSLSSIAFLAMLIGYKGEGHAVGSEPPPPPPPPPDWQQPEERSAADSHE